MPLLIWTLAVGGAVMLGWRRAPKVTQRRLEKRLQPVDEAYQDIVHRRIDSLLTSRKRRNQVAKFDPGANEKELAANRSLGLAAGSTVLVAVGGLSLSVISPVALVIGTGVPALLCLDHAIKYARRSWRERNLKYHFISNSVMVAMLVTGSYALLATAAITFYFLVFKVAARSEVVTQAAIRRAFGMQPPATVWQIVNGVETKVQFHDLVVGNVIAVTAGEAIPVDGQVTGGEGAIDQHVLTGESALSEKTAGDTVLANTLLVSGRLEIRIEKAGKDTAAAQIGEILIRASGADLDSTARTEQFVDKLTPLMVLSGGVAFAMHGAAGPIAIFNSGFTTPLMSGPLNMLSFLNIASEQGILIKDGRSLERLKEIDTVIFDKTGTLTMEEPRVVAVFVCEGWTEREVLSTAAMAEHRQSHPIARAILAAAAEENIEPAIPETAAYSLGMGVRVEANGCSVSVGSARFLDRQGVVLPAETEVWRAEVEAVGGSLVFVVVDDVCTGAVRLEVQLRPETYSLIADLKARGMRIYILSGDARRPTEHIGDILGVDGVFAEVLPTDKQTVIEDMQAQGRRVCFVGDGLNDALALRQADVSISIRGATTLATDSAQIVLMSQELSPINALFNLGKAFEHNLSRTLQFAFVPAGMVVGGVMLFGLGVPAAVMLFSVGIVSSVASALAPRYEDHARIPVSSGDTPAVKEGKDEGIKEGEAAAGRLAEKKETVCTLTK